MRQRRLARTPHGFGLLPFRSPLLRESSLFLGVLRCFSSPGALPARQGDGPSRPPGCPIRRSRDHRVPAPPPRISPRGRVLPRLQAPRHPPSAHTRRAFRRSAERASVPHAGHAPRSPGVVRAHARSRRLRPPSFFRFSALVRASHACVQPASLRTHRSSVTPARIGGPGNLGSGRRDELSKCGENRGKHNGRLFRAGGAAGTRTPDLRRAKAALSQLSYGPLRFSVLDAPTRHAASLPRIRWARLDSNQGPRPYQGRALTS